MNELFELLHKGHSALEIFAIDVVAFIAVVVLIRSVIFVAKHDVAWILKRNAHTPQFLTARTKPDKGRKK